MAMSSILISIAVPLQSTNNLTSKEALYATASETTVNGRLPGYSGSRISKGRHKEKPLLRLTTKLTVKSKIVLKCEKHRNYNPEKDGRDGVRGACSRCLYILSVYNSRQALVNAARDYEQISKEFETIKPRAPKVASPKPETELSRAMARNSAQYHLLQE